MNGIIRELEILSEHNIEELVLKRIKGTPIVEYNSTFIPEELIRAAGANTYYMCRGGEDEAPDAVLDNMLRFINPLARSTAGFLELGLDPVTPFADLVVAAQTDCHTVRMSELLEYKGIRLSKVGVPADWRREIAFEYYIRSLEEMLKTVESVTGKHLDDARAREYFRQSNAINGRFRRINELRLGSASPIGFEDYMRLMHLSFSVGDAELFTEKLDEIIGRLELAPARFGAEAPRILLVGRVIAIGDYTVTGILDQSGGAVVAEVLDEGVRVIEKDVDLAGDLVTAFAKNRYLDTLPIDIFQPSWEVRFRHIKQLLKSCRIDGVVWYQLAFDEIYDMEYTYISRKLDEIGMPLLKIETSYSYSPEETAKLTAQIAGFVRELQKTAERGCRRSASDGSC